MLYLDLKIGESVDIDQGRVVVRVEHKSGQNVRLAFKARPDIAIRRLNTENTGGTATRKLAPIG